MRVVNICWAPRGGLAHYTYNLCDALSKSGVEVLLITQKTWELEQRERTFSLVNILGRARYYPLSIFAISRKIEQTKPDIVHIQSYTWLIMDLFLIYVLKQKGFKVVLTAHDILPHNALFYHDWLLRRLYGVVDGIIVHSRLNMDALLNRFVIDAQRLAIIPHGAYDFFRAESLLTKGQAKAQLGIKEDSRVILAFGTIARYKGLDYLIKAFAKVRECLPNTTLCVAGQEKDSFTPYDSLLNSLGLKDNASLHIGYIPFEDVHIFFRAADIVALPYTENAYTSGVVKLAYSFGVPVVGSKVGELPESVINGKSGLLVSPYSTEELAESLITALSSEQRLIEMGLFASHFARTRYGWEDIAAKTQDFYRRVVFQSRKPEH